MSLKLTIPHVTCRESHKHHTKIVQVLRKCWHTQLWHSLSNSRSWLVLAAFRLSWVCCGVKLLVMRWSCLSASQDLIFWQKNVFDWDTKANLKYIQQWCGERKTLMGIGRTPNLIHSLNFLIYFFQEEMPMYLSHLETLQSLSKGLQPISSILRHFEAQLAQLNKDNSTLHLSLFTFLARLNPMETNSSGTE